MAEKKSLTISDPWAVWKAYDTAELCPEAASYGEYVSEETSILEKITLLHKDKYSKKGAEGGQNASYTPGVVIRVLSGKNANNDATTLGRETKSLNVRGTRPAHEELNQVQGKTPPLRATVRLFCYHKPMPWPKDLDDSAKMDQFPEFVAMDPEIDQQSNVAPGSFVWVSLHNAEEPLGGGKEAGYIMAALSAPAPTIYDIDISPKDGFDPKCLSPLEVQGAGSNYVANTVGILDVGPFVRRIKNKINLGVFGNGTLQTKSHFIACLLNSKKSTQRQMAGPADSYKNAFIWVGHLKNNGYMDHFDRPTTIGRETIIYAPKYFDIRAPYELIYYFHNRSGFGFSWVDGPNTTIDQAIANASLEGNDFTEIIGPAIKDLTLSGRNFILVIPEMMHSRGFGTESKNNSRIEKYVLGQDAGRGNTDKFAFVQRVKPEESGNEAAHAAIKKGLAARFHTLDSMVDLNRLVEREFSTFDGSFTGGNFANFDAEVTNILSSHLGVTATEHKTIVADGVSTITLTAMSTLDSRPLETVRPSRINYITNGEDFNSYAPIFEDFPSITLFDNYIRAATGLDFNYITKYDAGELNNNFFSYVGCETEFKKSFKPGTTPGRAFDRPASLAGGDASTSISLHMGFKNSAYGLSLDSESYINPGSLKFQRPKGLSAPMSEVPNHAAKLSTKPSVAAILEIESKIEILKSRMEFFDDFISEVNKGGTIPFNPCLSDKYKIFCIPAKPGDSNEAMVVNQHEDGRLQTMYKDWFSDFKDLTKQEMLQEMYVEVSHVERNLSLLDDVVNITNDVISEYTGKEDAVDTALGYYKKFRFNDWDPAISSMANNHRANLKSRARQFYTKEIHELKSDKLIEVRDRYTQAQLAKFSDPDCATPAKPLALLASTNLSGAFSTERTINCGSLLLPNPAPATYAELSNILPFYPIKEDFIGSKKNDILEKVPGYRLSGFKHLTRKANNRITYLNTESNGTKVWACLVPIMERAWENACVVSKYIPFRVAFGFRLKPTPNLPNTMSLHNMGLAIDIDPALNPSGNDVTSGVFTNSWKYGIGNNPEVDSLGVYAERYDDLEDNVYDYSLWAGDELMGTSNWEDAFGAHDDDDMGNYLTGMHKGNVICPLQSNPLLWVLVFCETSGMKWCNTTFMKKRHRGGQRWSPEDLYRLDQIFEIDNVVARVQAISQESVKGESLNNHMQFQWWSGRSTITFEEIREAAKINGVE